MDPSEIRKKSHYWNINEIEKIAEDPLPILGKIMKAFITYKLLFNLSVILSLINFSFLFLQFYNYYFLSDTESVTKYGAHTFTYVLVSLVPCVLMSIKLMASQIISIQKNLYCSLDYCTKQLREKMIRTSRFFEFIILFGFVILAWVVFQEITIKEPSFFGLDYIRHNIIKNRNFFVICFWISLAMETLCSFVTFGFGPYIALNFYFQIIILNERIGQIIGQRHPNINLVNDLEYQGMVKKRMKFCIVHFMKVSGFIIAYNKYSKYLLLITHFVGIIVVLNCCLTFYLDYENNPLWPVSMTIAAIYNCIVNVEIFQTVETEVNKIFDQYTLLPWYTFNRYNKKNYLILLLINSKGFKFSRFRSLPINREAILMYYDIFFKFIGLFIQLKKNLEE